MVSTQKFYDKQSLHLQAQVLSEFIRQNYVVCEKAKLFTIESDNLFFLPILKKNNKFVLRFIYPLNEFFKNLISTILPKKKDILHVNCNTCTILFMT